MSAQLGKLQALLARVQENREAPRVSAPATGATGAAPSPVNAPSAARVAAVAETLDGFDTAPPPPPPVARPEPAPPARAPLAAAPAREVAAGERASRAAVEEYVRVPDNVRSMRSAPEPRPAAARPSAPGATPLEMALEGEVARAAEAAADSGSTSTFGSIGSSSGSVAAAGGRILADPTPPTPTRAIAQAVSTHPPAQASSFAELLKRSLSLRPR